MTYWGERTLPKARMASSRARTATGSCSGAARCSARRRSSSRYTAPSAAAVRKPERSAATPAPGPMMLPVPWLWPEVTASEPSSLAMSSGVPSTLSICSGRSMWYWKTCQTPAGAVTR